MLCKVILGSDCCGGSRPINEILHRVDDGCKAPRRANHQNSAESEVVAKELPRSRRHVESHAVLRDDYAHRGGCWRIMMSDFSLTDGFEEIRVGVGVQRLLRSSAA